MDDNWYPVREGACFRDGNVYVFTKNSFLTRSDNFENLTGQNLQVKILGDDRLEISYVLIRRKEIASKRRSFLFRDTGSWLEPISENGERLSNKKLMSGI